ncbi:MAG: helix-turn-helix domain-containing protein [Bifidobacterium sp.]
MAKGMQGRSGAKPGSNAEAKREEILQAALEVFGERGFTNGTLQDVGDKVGMTRAGVLHYFGSKDNLLIQVLDYRDSQEVAEDMPGGMDCFRQLLYTTRRNLKRRGLVRAFTTFSSESIVEGNPGGEYFTKRYRDLRASLSEAFREILLQRRSRGGAGASGPDLSEADERRIRNASVAILGAMDGIQLQWLLDEREVDSLVGPICFAIKSMVAAVLDPPDDPMPDERDGE